MQQIIKIIFYSFFLKSVIIASMCFFFKLHVHVAGSYYSLLSTSNTRFRLISNGLNLFKRFYIGLGH